MTDGLQWLRDAYPEGFSVVFRASETPEGLLVKMGADPRNILRLTSAEAGAVDIFNYDPDGENLDDAGLDEEELREHGFLNSDAHVLRAGGIEGWAFAIEQYRAYATEPKIAEMLSLGSRYVTFSRSANTDVWVQYAENGVVIDAFDPILPGDATPTWLSVDEMLASDDSTGHVLGRLESQLALYVPHSAVTERLASAAFND